jgi:hypothetical protein
MRIFLLFAIALCLFLGCTKNSILPIDNDSGKNYLPFKLGSTWIYQIDSFVYSKTTIGLNIDSQ